MALEDRTTAKAEWHQLWQEISEGFVGGVQHALNNRVAALAAVAQVLGDGMADAQPLLGSLSREVERLQETVGLLSLLRRARSRTQEPVMLPELVGSLFPLLPHYSDLREVEFASDDDPGLLPLWAERDQLTRVLLVLLTTAGLRSQAAGSGRVRVRYRGDEREVVLTVESAGGSGVEPESGPAIPDVTAVRLPIRELGGEAELERSGAMPAAFAVRLPTLLEVRRRERAAGS